MLLSIASLGCNTERNNPMRRALIDDPKAMNVMHAFTSTDLKHWHHHGIQAWGLSSLGLIKDTNNDLLISCIQEVRPPTREEEKEGPPIYGFRFDGNSYQPYRWTINDPTTRAYIDPQPFEKSVWYISPSGLQDPARVTTPTPVRRSPEQITELAYPGITDPSPVRYKGRRLLFATHQMHIVQFEGDRAPMKEAHLTTETTQHFAQATVAYATVIDKYLVLVAQVIDNGRKIPALSYSTDALSWSRWERIDMPRTLNSCTSPVLGPHPNGGWILFCIEERFRTEFHR